MSTDLSSYDIRIKVKSNARKLTAEKNFRLKSIFGILCLTVFWLGVEFVSAIVLMFTDVFFFDTYGIISELTVFAIKILVVSPLIMGYFRLTGLMVRGDDPEFSTIFAFYKNGKSYVRSLVTGIIVILPVKLVETAISFGHEFIQNLEFENEYFSDILTFFYFIVIFGICTLLLIPYGILFTSVNSAAMSDEPALKCISKSISASKKRLIDIFNLRYSFFGWSVLSLLTVGVLFLIFTLPYMTATYHLYAGYLSTGTITEINSEDTDI